MVSSATGRPGVVRRSRRAAAAIRRRQGRPRQATSLPLVRKESPLRQPSERVANWHALSHGEVTNRCAEPRKMSLGVQLITWRSRGLKDRKKITIEGAKNTKDKKAGRGYWDGSNEDGRIGCGFVIKAVDKGSWITISKVAVPLKACTAMAAEIAGAGMLTGVLDLLFDKKTQPRKPKQLH